MSECHDCHGIGEVPSASGWLVCSSCDGTGMVDNRPAQGDRYKLAIRDRRRAHV